uniref:Methyltransferase domain-containing protein n=1 Tax=Chenopodium quinoa TaxID=63459 RepID=A0A803LUK4_CHEQI
MSSITNTLAPNFSRSQLQNYRRNYLNSVNFTSNSPVWSTFPRFSTLKLQASSAAVIETTPELVTTDQKFDTNESILGCPICFEPLTWSGDSTLSVDTAQGTTLYSNTSKKTYYANGPIFNLTASSGAKDYVESMPLVTEFFSTPAMSFLYERGWRQNFGLVFEMAKEYFKPVFGGNIVDASCGSGLFSRLFAKSGLFSRVVALDYSEAMLQQCYEFVKEDPGFPKEKLILVRADISRLPFVSGSIDAVHAGLPSLSFMVLGYLLEKHAVHGDLNSFDLTRVA